MANIAAIRSVGISLQRYLQRAYDAYRVDHGAMPACTFSVVSSGDLQGQDDPAEGGTQVLIFLYRVNIDAHLRNSGRQARPEMRPAPVSVDLHFLITFWTDSADNEHLVLAWTLRQLHNTPILDATTLEIDGGWAADDIVQLIPAELSNEDLMRIWDALQPSYRLSLAYIARVVRIDPDEFAEAGPVVASRFSYAIPQERP